MAAVSAACGCVIGAVLVVAVLFEDWPAARLRPLPNRVLTLVLVALVALVLHRAFGTYAAGRHWTRATADDWVTTAALGFLGTAIVLCVGVGLRWPFAPKDP